MSYEIAVVILGIAALRVFIFAIGYLTNWLIKHPKIFNVIWSIGVWSVVGVVVWAIGVVVRGPK